MATLDPAEHTAQLWLPWRDAMDKVFSPTNRDAIWQLQKTGRGMKEASKLGQFSWALFDWANQPFFTVVTHLHLRALLRQRDDRRSGEGQIDLGVHAIGRRASSSPC